jgi:hypothetical protein
MVSEIVCLSLQVAGEGNGIPATWRNCSVMVWPGLRLPEWMG